MSGRRPCTLCGCYSHLQDASCDCDCHWEWETVEPVKDDEPEFVVFDNALDEELAADAYAKEQENSDE